MFLAILTSMALSQQLPSHYSVKVLLAADDTPSIVVDCLLNGISGIEPTARVTLPGAVWLGETVDGRPILTAYFNHGNSILVPYRISLGVHNIASMTIDDRGVSVNLSFGTDLVAKLPSTLRKKLSVKEINLAAIDEKSIAIDLKQAAGGWVRCRYSIQGTKMRYLDSFGEP